MVEYHRTVFTIEDRGIRGLDLLDIVSDSVRDWFREKTGWPVHDPSGTLEDNEQEMILGGAKVAWRLTERSGPRTESPRPVTSGWGVHSDINTLLREDE